MINVKSLVELAEGWEKQAKKDMYYISKGKVLDFCAHQLKIALEYDNLSATKEPPANSAVAAKCPKCNAPVRIIERSNEYWGGVHCEYQQPCPNVSANNTLPSSAKPAPKPCCEYKKNRVCDYSSISGKSHCDTVRCHFICTASGS